MSVTRSGSTDGRSRPELEGELADQLRALDGLDAEFRAGDLEESDYRSLRDDYTVRVADTMREARGSQDIRPGRRRPAAMPLAAVVAAESDRWRWPPASCSPSGRDGSWPDRRGSGESATR